MAIHRFAHPEMSARQLILPIPALVPGANHVDGLKLGLPSAWELGMLFVAIGPLALLVSASLVLWNR